MNRSDVCKHFNGVQHGSCEAGINYEQFKGRGNMLSILPCFLRNNQPCEKRELWDEQELKTMEMEDLASIETVMRVMEAVTSGIKSGSIICHCGGTIMFAYEGPTSARAKCESCDWSMIA